VGVRNGLTPVFLPSSSSRKIILIEFTRHGTSFIFSAFPDSLHTLSPRSEKAKKFDQVALFPPSSSAASGRVKISARDAVR